MKTLQVRIGDNLYIGSDHPIVVQTMCNTHTYDVEATVDQCRRMAAAGAQLIRITVPGLQDVENITTHSTGVEPNRCVVIEFVR